MNFDALRVSLLAVSVYKQVLDAPVMEAVMRMLGFLGVGEGELALDAYTDIFCNLESEGYQDLGGWLADALRWDEGPFPRAAERGKVGKALECAARRDVSAFAQLAEVEHRAWREALVKCLGTVCLPELPQWPAGAPFSFEALSERYRKEGAGEFARFRAFVWEDGALVPVPDPDCPAEDELLGYDEQREEVARNTRALLAGRYVNNVLLYGESGTGKSATVKNLLTLPGMEELRIIEADKENLAGLPALIRSLRGRRQKFIIFIDDLSFDRDDPTYSILKTILEGGIERRPDNVAVYATSNRRHLIRQTISERAGDEMDRSETIQEKTSLADRFGLRVLFQGLNKAQFLDLVDMLAARQGLELETEELHRRAVVWERLHAARTPRAALQFTLAQQENI